MNSNIKKLLNTYKNEEELRKLEDDIKVVKDIFSGKYCYCEDCSDYYLSESFICKEEVNEESVCIYKDPINSGGNEYKNKLVRKHYTICPKGHKKIKYSECM